MKNARNWVLDTASGNDTASGADEKQYEGEAGTLYNGTNSQSFYSCSSGKSAGIVTGSSGGTVLWSNVTSTSHVRTTLRIKHLNGNSNQRTAEVGVSGNMQRVGFLLHEGVDPRTSVVHVDLKAGVNEVKISMQGAWRPDVDRALVRQS